MTEVISEKALVGRFSVTAAVVDCLLDVNGPGVLLFGDAGIGKTALINEVVHELGQRIRPFRVFAGPTLASVPFAALAPLLTALTPGQINEPLSVLRAVVAALNPAGQPHPAPAVLIVEDAHHIDDSSVAVLAQLAAAEAAKVVFLCRPYPAPPAEVFSMWSEGLVDRFDLQPLNEQEVNQLCAQALDAPVVQGTSAVLCKYSGGNPMFLLELIEHAKSLGQLVCRNDAWMLSGELRGTSVRLMDLVRNQILMLGAAQRETLETVALAEPVPLSVVQKASDSSAVDELQELHFIEIASDPARHVRLAQPLVGEVIRQLVPTAHSMTVRRRIVNLMESKPQTMDGLLRHVSWGLESGIEVPDSDILEAAQLANRLFIPSYVERVAGAIKDPSLKLTAQVEVARAKWYRGDIRGSVSSLAGVVDRTNDPRTVRLASMLAAQLAGRQGVGPNAIKQAAYEWEAALAKLAESRQGIDPDELERGKLGSRLLSLEGLQAEGHYIETERELRQIWQEADDDESRLVAGTLLAEALAVTGRPVSAIQILMEIQEMVATSGDWSLQYAGMVMRRYILALQQAGEFGVLETYLKNHVSQAPNSLIYSGGMLHLAAGMVELRRGDLGVALPRLRQAVSMLRVSDMGSDLPDAVAAAAYAASILKRRETAMTYSNEYDALIRDGVHPSLLAQGHAAVARAEHTGSPTAIARLMSLADSAAADGAIGAEIDILMLVLRLGDPGVARRLTAVAEGSEGRTAEFALNVGRALTHKDADRLIELSDSAAKDGLELAAADCAGYALRILESRGDKARQLEGQRLLKRRTAALDKAGPAVNGGSPDLQKLTRREQEIATMVQSGASNKDIALSLGLSLRTVEGHLYRMFAKLGIGHREDLMNGAHGSQDLG
ncbi:LuxR C-terminal-related transcriptional regulator [Arthrobacter bambusae]|uniref:LuxR C-terminal-related transcriptional regulator n=1 Tax=Arthrobacter bambusae TaxID=1338426 RepID=UPI00278A04A9|nr:LuxR family transcriptional regulator [Arthrobacter bambusae]MDQ0029228.1 DNA-binding CsgD family transcriptional regulator [Arthrobacter bambusae]MDQ0098137.1 DNA-binding CsgD family transcriptional regulator [Arthrobacter bambusae]